MREIFSLFYVLGEGGEGGDKKAEDRGKWRFKRGRSGGLGLCSATCLQHCLTSLVNIVL